MPNYRRYYLAAPVFVTLVTAHRRPCLLDAAAQVSASMHRAQDRHPFHHLAHVVLPDHLHWLFEASDTNFSAVVSAFKRDFTWSRKTTDSAAHSVWQARFYDHLIRDDDDLYRHLDYIHYNPVKHGYCTHPLDWPHSSFPAWLARGAYPANWGESPPPGILDMALD
ncbi:MAG: transposase [Thiobacillaceae bacterium]